MLRTFRHVGTNTPENIPSFLDQPAGREPSPRLGVEEASFDLLLAVKFSLREIDCLLPLSDLLALFGKSSRLPDLWRWAQLVRDESVGRPEAACIAGSGTSVLPTVSISGIYIELRANNRVLCERGSSVG